MILREINNKIDRLYLSSVPNIRLIPRLKDFLLPHTVLERLYPFTPHCIFLQEYRTIYIPIPKVACTTLKQVCYALIHHRQGTVKRIHQASFPTVQPQEIDAYQDHTIFCFVRNPWDRLVSCYADKIRNTSLTNRFYTDGVFNGFLKYKTPMGYPAFIKGMSFLEFAYTVANIPDREAENHFRSQYWFLTDKNGRLRITYTGKYENFQNDFDRLKTIAKWPQECELPHMMQSKRQDYRQYYTPEIRDIVAERYAKDISLFDYHF